MLFRSHGPFLCREEQANCAWRSRDAEACGPLITDRGNEALSGCYD